MVLLESKIVCFIDNFSVGFRGVVFIEYFFYSLKLRICIRILKYESEICDYMVLWCFDLFIFNRIICLNKVL